MAKGILGEKLGMLQVWDKENRQVTVTAIKAGPCSVTQIKKEGKDGYNSVQIGFRETKAKALSNAQIGHLKNALPAAVEAGQGLPSCLRELRDFPEEKTVGDVLTCGIFAEGEKVFIQASGKGKGFQGVVKRYGFGGGRKTHGSKFHRNTGSIGAGTDPGNVSKGKRMPGRMGGKTVTKINIEIVQVIPEENLLLVKGGVPGTIGSTVFVYKN